MNAGKIILKGILSISLCLALVFMYLPLTALAVASDLTDSITGVTLTDSDADGYYDINSKETLYAFSNIVNAGNVAINGELTADIVVNEGVLTAEGKLQEGDFIGWTPIADYSAENIEYSGAFEGNDHYVSGLYFSNGDARYIGLFGYIGENGVVQNVGVVDSYFYAHLDIAGMAGYNEGTVKACYNSATVSGGSYADHVGGVVGCNAGGSIADCYNTGVVKGYDCVGGVAGQSNGGYITGCYNKADIQATGSQAGGVVGYAGNDSTVTNCYNSGSVEGGKKVGGVVGTATSATVSLKNCYSIGAVICDALNVGGIAGANNGAISNCYFNSDIFSGDAMGTGKGTTDSLTGGKKGEAFASGEVTWLLNGSSGNGVWKQTIGETLKPEFSGKNVYALFTCMGNAVIGGYSNTEIKAETHIFANGSCTECGAFEFDYNGDGSVNIKDMVRIKNYLAGNTDIIAKEYDANGVIEAADLVNLRKSLLAMA